MYRIGITFGGFIPLHKGHLTMINRSLKENHKTVIAVCGKDDDRGKNFIPFRERIRLIHQIYDGNPDCIVTWIDDEKLGLTGTFSRTAWGIWCRELFETTGLNPSDSDTDYTWYTGEHSYKEKLEQCYPRHEFLILDRNHLPISGTMIREHPETYQDSIHPVFLAYLKEHHII